MQPNQPSTKTPSVSPAWAKSERTAERGRGRTAHSGVHERPTLPPNAPGPLVHLEQESYTSGQAARLLGIPARTMRHYLSSGRVSGVQNPITGTWHLSRANLSDFVCESGRAVAEVAPEVKLVLVASDPTLQEQVRTAREHLVPHGVLLIPATAGEALIQIGLHRPAVIILDTRMTIDHGRDVLAAVRRTRDVCAAKLLAVGSADDSPAELVASGADECLRRPFGYQELVSKLGVLLPRAAGRR